jgi:hypothetical protein
MSIPVTPFRHLLRLSDDTGLLEHSWLAVPRRDLGYTTDDTARGLIAVCRQPDPGPELVRLGETYLAFLGHARDPGRGFRNRFTYHRTWTETDRSDDAAARALWALGCAAAKGPTPYLREAARHLMEESLDFRSPYLRASAYLVLGCAELLAVESDDPAARRAIEEAVAVLGAERATANWPWPEDRLTYDNARIPEALLAAGSALSRPRLTKDGLSLLRWLVAVETRGDNFSFVPVGGWVRGEPRPAFDQQPIEVAGMADACRRAWDVTGDPFWKEQVERAAAWLLGGNDAGVPLYDPDTQGCCDGLEASGVNRNQGAESTLAMITTFQQVNRLAR